MKAQIENLKALIHGKELTNYQRALALNEWSKLIAHIGGGMVSWGLDTDNLSTEVET